jgi:hypothetical protein
MEKNDWLRGLGYFAVVVAVTYGGIYGVATAAAWFLP